MKREWVSQVDFVGRGRGMLKGPEIRAHGDALDDKKVAWLE